MAQTKLIVGNFYLHHLHMYVSTKAIYESDVKLSLYVCVSLSIKVIIFLRNILLIGCFGVLGIY